MRILFFGHFEKLFGKERHLHMKRTIILQELINQLSLQYPGFAYYAEKKTDVDLSAHVMFLKDGRPLKLSDSINSDDTVKVLIPAMGG